MDPLGYKTEGLQIDIMTNLSDLSDALKRQLTGGLRVKGLKSKA